MHRSRVSPDRMHYEIVDCSGWDPGMFYPSSPLISGTHKAGSARVRAKTDYDCTRKRDTTLLRNPVYQRCR